MNYLSKNLLLLLLGGVSVTSMAEQTSTELQQCVMKAVVTASDNKTVGQLREKCALALEKKIALPKAKAESPVAKILEQPGALSKRFIREQQTEFDPYVITPHMMNYILPVLTTNQITPNAYNDIAGFSENFEDMESKFQLSLKVPLNDDDILFDGDALYFAFTIEAWWQIYSDNISKPFRETNYKPEFFYAVPLGWQPFGGNTGLMIGAEHQSNGRSQLLSRSWNRIYTNFLFEKGDFAFSFKPWWRLPEDDKAFDLDPDGDDNPDIEDYMGHFELGMAYTWNDYELSLKGRRNFSENNGALELGFTFPLWGKLRGYALVFDGYGESLIDYNHKQTRFGLGIALNNIL